jgi:hypothetical protein
MSDRVPPPLDHPSLAHRPTVRELIEVLRVLVDQWEEFGHFLPGITSPDIQAIKQNESRVESMKRALHNKWLSIDPNASWKSVIIALYRARENTLAVGVTNTIITDYNQDLL